MKKIYLDYDNTLVHFIEPFIKTVNELENTKLTTFNYKDEEHKEIIKKHYNLLKEGNHYKNVSLIPNSIEFVKKLKETYSVSVITSSMSKDQKKYKGKHIDIHFPKMFENVISARKKHPHSKDGIFIDDDINKVREHCLNNDTLGILINHNESFKHDPLLLAELKKYANFKYTTNFDEIYNKIENHENKQTNGNVIIIGETLSGKSTISLEIGKHCNMKVFDLDKEVEKKYGSIFEMVKNHDMEYINQKFEKIFKELNKNNVNTVISTGGFFGTYFKDFTEEDNVIYLDISYDLWEKRVKEAKKNPEEHKNRRVVKKESSELKPHYENRNREYMVNQKQKLSFDSLEELEKQKLQLFIDIKNNKIQESNNKSAVKLNKS